MSDLVVDAAATARLVQLLVRDVAGKPVRNAVIRWAYKRAGDPVEDLDRHADLVEIVKADATPPPIAYLVTCNYCSGVWLAIGVTAARLILPRQWAPVARMLATAGAASVLVNKLGG